jgi:hypothetical protein
MDFLSIFYVATEAMAIKIARNNVRFTPESRHSVAR